MIRIPSKGDVLVAVAMDGGGCGEGQGKVRRVVLPVGRPIHSGTEYIVDP